MFMSVSRSSNIHRSGVIAPQSSAKVVTFSRRALRDAEV
jgi:hypothetical protein